MQQRYPQRGREVSYEYLFPCCLFPVKDALANADGEHMQVSL
jgi:hypothetical protein